MQRCLVPLNNSFIVFHCIDLHNLLNYPLDGHLGYYQSFASFNTVVNCTYLVGVGVVFVHICIASLNSYKLFTLGSTGLK